MLMESNETFGRFTLTLDATPRASQVPLIDSPESRA